MNEQEAKAHVDELIALGVPPARIIGQVSSWNLDGEAEIIFRYAREKADAMAGAEPTHLTDIGNAQRFAKQYGQVVRYSYDRKKWLIWNGKHWEWDDGDKIMAMGKMSTRSIWNEVADEEDEARHKALIKHATLSENEHRVASMLALAQSEPGIPINIDELDRSQWLLNVSNGTIDLRTGVLKTHDRHDFITAIIPFDYHPDAQGQRWNETLDMFFDGHPEIREYVQRALGYSCTGSQIEQVTFFPYGPGGNGKSTILGACMDALGPYACEVEPQVFMVGKYDTGGVNEGLSRLIRKRLAISTEIQEGQRLSTTLIKRMTGGEKIHHELKYEHGFEFEPTHKLWLSGNHRPIITDTTHSIWRRVKFINFTYSIPEEKRIKGMRENILRQESEQKGILAWLVAGCVKYIKEGLGEPDEVTDATAQYREEMDVLADFLLEKCAIDPDARMLTGDLYRVYKEWGEANDSITLGKQKFGARLQERGVVKGRGHANKPTWFGIRLLADGEENQKVTKGQKVTLPIQAQLGYFSDEKTESRYAIGSRTEVPVKPLSKSIQSNHTQPLDKTAQPLDSENGNNYPSFDCPGCGHDAWAMAPDGSYFCADCGLF